MPEYKTTEIVKLTMKDEDEPIHLRVRCSDERTAEKMRRIFAGIAKEVSTSVPVKEPEGKQ